MPPALLKRHNINSALTSLYFVFNDPNWDLTTFNFDTDVNKTLANPIEGLALEDVVSSIDPDLSVFRAHNGKMIQYHGTTDAAIPPGNSIEYYRTVQAFFGIYDRQHSAHQVENFYRLFLVPGMQHCSGGPGANTFGQGVPLADSQHDVIKALEAWVEQGKAPDQIIATKYINDDPTQQAQFTRPLCPYPTLARWNGTGDASDAANWSCR